MNWVNFAELGALLVCAFCAAFIKSRWGFWALLAGLLSLGARYWLEFSTGKSWFFLGFVLPVLSVVTLLWNLRHKPPKYQHSPKPVLWLKFWLSPLLTLWLLVSAATALLSVIPFDILYFQDIHVPDITTLRFYAGSALAALAIILRLWFVDKKGADEDDKPVRHNLPFLTAVCAPALVTLVIYVSELIK